MDFFEFQEAVEQTMKSDNPLPPMLNWALGLAGEVSECVEPVKKYFFHGYDINRRAMALELGDALFYLGAMASEMGFSMNEIAELNIEKRKARFPDAFKE